MNRYCEIKLKDVLLVDKSVNFMNRNKTTKTPSSIGCTSEVDKTALLKRKSGEDRKDLVEVRRGRLAKKSKTVTKPNLSIESTDTDSSYLNEVIESKTIAGKRKRSYNKVMRIGEQFSKNLSSPGSSLSTSSKNSDAQINKRKKVKRTPRESCWENKLTGAKRVSKRLSNMKIAKEKSSKNLEYSSVVPQVSITSKQPMNLISRGKIKSDKKFYRKPLESRKASLYGNQSEVFNFGKLSHTKRLYPKIKAGKQSAKCTITKKPSGSIGQSRKKGNQNKLYEGTKLDCDVNSLVKDYLKDIEEEIPCEVEGKVPELDKMEDEGISMPNDQCESEETKEESNVEATTQENKFQHLFCNITEEEDIDSSTIVIVDIESGENVDCISSNEKAAIIIEKSEEEEKETGEATDQDGSGKTLAECMILTDLKHNNSNEKTNSVEEDNLNSVANETDNKQVVVNNDTFIIVDNACSNEEDSDEARTAANE